MNNNLKIILCNLESILNCYDSNYRYTVFNNYLRAYNLKLSDSQLGFLLYNLKLSIFQNGGE